MAGESERVEEWKKMDLGEKEDGKKVQWQKAIFGKARDLYECFPLFNLSTRPYRWEGGDTNGKGRSEGTLTLGGLRPQYQQMRNKKGLHPKKHEDRYRLYPKGGTSPIQVREKKQSYQRLLGRKKKKRLLENSQTEEDAWSSESPEEEELGSQKKAKLHGPEGDLQKRLGNEKSKEEKPKPLRGLGNERGKCRLVKRGNLKR